MFKNFKNLGPALIVFAAILWSIDGILRRSLYSLPAPVVVFYEHLIGFIILFPLLIPHIKLVKKIKPKVWGAFFWVTLLGSILGTIFYTSALGMVNYIQFSAVVLLQQTQPLFAVFFAGLILKEKIDKKFFLYLVLALAGAYLVSFPNLSVNWQDDSKTIMAALLAMGAAFAWGSSTAFGRYGLLEVPAILGTGLRFGLATILGILAVYLTGSQGSLMALDLTQWFTLMIIALSTGMVALAIYYYGLKKTPAHISAICELTWPVSAIAIDYFYFQKPLSETQILGALILTLTILKVTRLARKTL
ncbi:hypothetical protein A3C59_04105 [Candidatus Daviesbacteria bacterium RIFCSPHIGHO2_02_FULL_36_13]|uniref:EamA domain-containing protein n=1 Tax=Candidatus Daviesbacteria bacterium RIFCSPHIGHO2_02_FULL_36_13 TaxID=1797768 RepID=A0A1F5JR96_9BACT|nr:MAG: hypothetical protein A3C59_04105 [Candidatus Daviesbacteria bacterium RIFCSPHIGHO2_02_FULL_36_13]